MLSVTLLRSQDLTHGFALQSSKSQLASRTRTGISFAVGAVSVDGSGALSLRSGDPARSALNVDVLEASSLATARLNSSNIPFGSTRCTRGYSSVP